MPLNDTGQYTGGRVNQEAGKKSCKARLKLHNHRLRSLNHVALIPKF